MKKIAWSLLLGASLSVGFIACGGDNNEEGSSSCANDNDCKGDRICAAGECVDPSGGGGTGGGGTGGGGTGGGGTGGGGTGGGGTGGGGTTDATCAQVCTKVIGCDPSVTQSDCEAGCNANIDQASRNCIAASSTCPDLEACLSGGGGGGGGGGEAGAIGSNCDDSDDCDSKFCRKPAGEFEGKCAVNDFGNMCQTADDCEYNGCLYRDLDNDAFGYCTTTCSDFTDCPTFWSCKEVGNANGTYCVQD